MSWVEDIEPPDAAQLSAIRIRHVGTQGTSLMRYTVCAAEAPNSMTSISLLSTLSYNDADDAAVWLRRRVRMTRRLLGFER